MLLQVYAILAVTCWIALTFYLIINSNKIKYLSTITIEKTCTPSVAIIIPVRNEQDNLQHALKSVCRLNYPNYKIIVVNDRSTDDSAKILAALQNEYQQINVINIETLPENWLGKNHALYKGYTLSNDEYLLFTDADVVFEEDVLSKAMQYVIKNKLDHLTILPEINCQSSILKSVITTLIIMLTAMQRPWAAKLKSSKASMGVGAFNLVRRKAYERAGTHKAIAMRPDDDLKLAVIMKSSGGKADVLYGLNELKVEWYKSVKEFIEGLMKNAFSGFNYNILKAVGGALGTLLFFVLPLPVILLLGNKLQRCLVVYMLLFQVILYWKLPGSKGKWWYSLMSIYGGMIMTFVIIKSSFITIRNGGIFWRGTFYSLKQLRKEAK